MVHLSCFIIRDGMSGKMCSVSFLKHRVVHVNKKIKIKTILDSSVQDTVLYAFVMSLTNVVVNYKWDSYDVLLNNSFILATLPKKLDSKNAGL